MARDDQPPTSEPRPNDWFATTHWSVVLTARSNGATDAEAALARLCQTYWYPLYVFVRRQGHDEESAKDLTQGFFARFLEKDYLGQVHRERGRFRCFLLASMKHFLADEWDKARAQKRGGGMTFLPLQTPADEAHYGAEPIDAMDAEKIFERRWALTLLAQARERLKQEYADSGKALLYDRLKVFNSGDQDGPPYAEVAESLGLTESGIKSAILRMRNRYRELIRAEVANTVNSRDEIDDEIRHLITVIST